MDVQVEKKGAYLAKVSVTLPQADVDRAFDAALRQVGKQARLPGFRPGKVPRSLLERHFGGQIHDDVQNKLVEGSLFAALDAKGVAAVAMPTVTVGTLQRGSAFSYSLEVEVRPEITLAQYKGLEAAPVRTTLEPGEVAARLESMRKEAAQTVPVVGRTVAEAGDFVLLDYIGSIGGVPFDGGSAKNSLVELAATDYIPGFAEGIIGAEVPGQRDVPVDFPPDYSVAQLAGQSAVFAMTLKELKTRELPSLDDAFAQDMGAESLDALQSKVTAELTERQAQAAQSEQRSHMLRSLVEANPFEVPPSMIDSQVERLVASAQARVERMTGHKVDLDSQAVAELRGSSRDDAEFQVRSGLLMVEVSKAENIAVQDSDVDAEVDRLVVQSSEHAEVIRSTYQQEERREELRFRLLEDRVVAFLVEQSKPC